MIKIISGTNKQGISIGSKPICTSICFLKNMIKLNKLNFAFLYVTISNVKIIAEEVMMYKGMCKMSKSQKIAPSLNHLLHSCWQNHVEITSLIASLFEQGTIRPARYHVLHDEVGFSAHDYKSLCTPCNMCMQLPIYAIWWD
jgi:hypothetical protein